VLPNEKVQADYWRSTHSQPRWRLPSRLNVGTNNLLRIISGHARQGMRVLEIGCAPGKFLAYLAQVQKASVCGLDYSEPGVAFSRELFSKLNLSGEIRCENIFTTTFPEASFDLVYSLGVIEHFDDARTIVEKHLFLTKPGGSVVITIPNFGGIYGRIERHFSPELLNMHNLQLMNCQALVQLMPERAACVATAYRSGRLSPWILNFEKKWPATLAKATSYALNALGLVQPFDIGPLCPLLVLMMKKSAVS
jgi:2-polyprenyl-3-methyl-5-hydroxy-6-metoxy-1,4-benzoquinol methylase